MCNSSNTGLDDKLQVALREADIENEENEGISVTSVESPSDIESKISAENSRINRELLIPELVANEKQKRNLKMFLLIGVIVFIAAQITVMSVYIGQLVYSVTIGSNKLTNIDKELCKSLIGFMKFFVSATLCEFIAMLFFIVKYVFDKSIFELIKLFKSDETNKSGETNLNNELKYTVDNGLNYNDEDNSKSA